MRGSIRGMLCLASKFQDAFEVAACVTIDSFLTTAASTDALAQLTELTWPADIGPWSAATKDSARRDSLRRRRALPSLPSKEAAVSPLMKVMPLLVRNSS